jgi:tetratricopeptide (TPR) repeat protein
MRNKVFILLLFISSSLLGQRCIKQSNKLIAEKKYRSAWEVLDKADPKNQKPSIALAKTNLLLSYFINTVMHKVFTLKDIQSSQKVDDFRGKDENGNLIRFDPEEILDTLLKHNPTEYTLYEGLGNYYYETFILFQENWVKKPEELVKLIETNYQIASDHGIKTAKNTYRIGFAQLFLQRFKEARSSFSESIRLNPSFPDAYYSLAYSCLHLNENDSALRYAKQAYQLFTDTFNRSDVHLLLGLIYSAKKDSVSSLQEYRDAAFMNPKNQSMSQLLLKAALRYNAPDLHAIASNYFDMDPKGPDTYNQLINGYFQANKSKEIMSFMEEKLNQYSKDAEVSGSICFYRAYVYVILEEKVKARADLLKAKELFSRVYAPDNEMFSAIQDALKELDKEAN